LLDSRLIIVSESTMIHFDAYDPISPKRLKCCFYARLRSRSHVLGSNLILVALLRPWIRHFTRQLSLLWWLRKNSKVT